jgi:hypothetical protein
MPPFSSRKCARIYLDGEIFFMSAALVESQRNTQNATYRCMVRADERWFREIRQGANARDYCDRYSAQDTIREQRNIYLTSGTRLMSTEGNALLTIVADTCGRYDTPGGACPGESNMVRYWLDKRYMQALISNNPCKAYNPAPIEVLIWDERDR